MNRLMGWKNGLYRWAILGPNCFRWKLLIVNWTDFFQLSGASREQLLGVNSIDLGFNSLTHLDIDIWRTTGPLKIRKPICIMPLNQLSTRHEETKFRVLLYCRPSLTLSQKIPIFLKLQFYFLFLKYYNKNKYSFLSHKIKPQFSPRADWLLLSVDFSYTMIALININLSY